MRAIPRLDLNVADHYHLALHYWGRLRRGWGFRDAWNGDQHLARIVVEMIDHYHEVRYSIPSEWNDEVEDLVPIPDFLEIEMRVRNGFSRYLIVHEKFPFDKVTQEEWAWIGLEYLECWKLLARYIRQLTD